MKQLIYFVILAVAIGVLINFEVVSKEHLVWSLTVFIPAFIQLFKNNQVQKSQLKTYKKKMLDLEVRNGHLLRQNDELFEAVMEAEKNNNDEEM